MDYNVVADILRECHISLRNQINPLDTLPHMKSFTVNEEDKIKCELKNEGKGPANDKLLDVVRSKPNSLVDLLFSLKINCNEELFEELRYHIGCVCRKWNRASQADDLLINVQRKLEGFSGDGSGNSGALKNDARLELQEGPGTSPPGNQGATESTPTITLVRDNSSASGISFTASSPVASPTDSDYEGKEVNDLDMIVVEALGKELEKTMTDGSPGWEHILRYVTLRITMGEKKKVGRAHKPGEACLELLGDKGLKIGQLKEALLMNNLRLANQIMFEENDARSGLHPSCSEGDISQLGRNNGQPDSKEWDQQDENIQKFTSLHFNNLKIGDQQQKSPNGIKRIISTETVSANTGISSENEDQSHRRESYDTNVSDSAYALSPSDTSASSVFSNGSNVGARSLYSSSGIGECKSSIDTQETSVGSMEGRKESLKSTRPIEAVGDPEKKEAVLNFDIELKKFQSDVRHQPEVFGNTSRSLDNIPIQNRTQAEIQSGDQSVGLAENISDNGNCSTIDNLTEEVNQDQT